MDINFRHVSQEFHTSIDRKEPSAYALDILRNGLIGGEEIVITYSDGTKTIFNPKED